VRFKCGAAVAAEVCGHNTPNWELQRYRGCDAVYKCQHPLRQQDSLITFTLGKRAYTFVNKKSTGERRGVNTLKRKGFNRIAGLDAGNPESQVRTEVSLMNASRTTTAESRNFTQAQESKSGFRTKTISMRLTPDEVAELESAAQRAGKQTSEWLREMALTAAREQPSDPLELLLAEVWAVRHALLSLFHAGTQATVEGKPLLPESVLKIRDSADRKKLDQARRMLADFLGQQAKEGVEER
jgi:hypothetical protein